MDLKYFDRLGAVVGPVLPDILLIAYADSAGAYL